MKLIIKLLSVATMAVMLFSTSSCYKDGSGIGGSIGGGVGVTLKKDSTGKLVVEQVQLWLNGGTGGSGQYAYPSGYNYGTGSYADWYYVNNIQFQVFWVYKCPLDPENVALFDRNGNPVALGRCPNDPVRYPNGTIRYAGYFDQLQAADYSRGPIPVFGKVPTGRSTCDRCAFKVDII
jgi:hypothetical protein